jgi:16S rRNA (cytosine967-C5)-methyltransferase
VLFPVPASPARRLAFDILLRVERDAAFSTELLHAGSRENGIAGVGRLDPRDHGLATEIVLGCLRRQGEIDHLLNRAAQRPIARLDPEVRAALRMGCYQLRFLDRIPDRAAVSESVELVKAARKRSAAGFVNAVLRKLPERVASQEALELSYPAWMVERWRKHYGPKITAGILGAGVAVPPVYLRLSPAFDFRETLQLLAGEGVETEAAEAPGAYRVVRGRVQDTQCFRDRRCRIQDLSSQCVVPLLDLKPEHSFLDLCAAPGGKTFQAIDVRGSARGVVAADRHLHRLRTLRHLAGSSVDCVVLDGQRDLPFRRAFDRILVDAPCTGTGTLARNPEIKWRLQPGDIGELARMQSEILSQALERLAPEGLLVYSTCSLEAEENQVVLDSVHSRKPGFRLGAYFQRIPGREPGDGFFACQIRRA